MSETSARYFIPQAPPWPETVQLALDALGRAAMPAGEKAEAMGQINAALAASINYWGVRPNNGGAT